MVEQREAFFDRVDILCLCLSFTNLVFTAGLTVIYSVLNRDDGIQAIIDGDTKPDSQFG